MHCFRVDRDGQTRTAGGAKGAKRLTDAAVTPGSSQKPLIPVFASKSPNSVASPPHPLDGIEKIHKTVIHVQLHVAVEKT